MTAASTDGAARSSQAEAGSSTSLRRDSSRRPPRPSVDHPGWGDAGASQGVGMRLLGHKTASMFLRYDVLSLDDLSDAVARAEVPRNVSRTSQSAGAAREG